MNKIVLLGVILAAALTSCGRPSASSEPKSGDYTYTVTGSAQRINVQYDAGSAQSSLTSVKVPWTTQSPSMGFVNAAGYGKGRVTCTITGPDGSIVSTQTSPDSATGIELAMCPQPPPVTDP